MRKALLVALVLTAAALHVRSGRSQTTPAAEPTVRIGLSQTAAAVTLRSDSAFRIQQNSTRSAKFTAVLAVDPSAGNRVLRRADLQYRMIVELDEGRLVVLPMSTKVMIDAPAMPIE